MERTAKQKAALRKAQLASARKRRGTGVKRQYGRDRNGRKSKAPIQAAVRKRKKFGGTVASKNRKIDRKIARVESRTKRKVSRHAKTVNNNAYTHSTEGGVYLNARGAKAYKKGVKAHNRGVRKVNRLKRRKR